MVVLYPHVQTSPYVPLSLSLRLPIHFIFVFPTHVCLVYTCQPTGVSQPVCHWRLKIISVRPQHPIIHGICQVPCCHGNYAELSGRLVDIYRVETPTFSLDQVAEPGWALWRRQVRGKYHRVLNGLTRQTFWRLMSWTSTSAFYEVRWHCKSKAAQLLYITKLTIITDKILTFRLLTLTCKA